ncbi:PREDICTED: uncharacterized protein LOC107103823 [Cyprinodon variegatus]|uniref:uncharacterized protein LOC107103823 n=1 Tax=Cyprinodon variegatus TaxID=28743 RepID=UPI0007425A20|nr:PREDICTED: uncharacterized protein LOC107103823 [Cyprinodon variegatus]
MPVVCAANGCNNRRSTQSRSRRITFHKFPSRGVARHKALLGHWPPTAYAPPAIHKYRQAHCPHPDKFLPKLPVEILMSPPSKRKTQTPTKAEQSQLLDLSRKAEFSLLLDLSKPLPESNETATEAEESQPLDLSMKTVNNPPLDPLQDLPESKPQPNDDHSYALPCSPTLIKARLSDALNRVEILEQENLNAKAREQRAKKYIERLLDDLKRKNLTNT